MYRRLAILVLTLLLVAQISARELVVVNGLGETADWVDLDGATVEIQVATLGLTPNDFLINGSLGVAVNSGSNDLYFYNLPSMSPAGSVWLGNSRNPWSGDWLNTDTLVVTNWLTSSIALIDVAAQSVIAEHPIGVVAENINHPQSIVILNRKAYITMSCFDELFQYHPGKLEIFDLDADSTVKRLDVNLNPQDIALGQDGYLYLVCTGNYFDVFGKLYRINPVTDALVDSLAIGGQPAAIATTGQGIAFLAAGGWSKSGPTPKWLNPQALSWGTANKGTAGLVYTVDLNDWQILHGPANSLQVNNGVVNLATVSDSSVMLCCFQDDIVVEIDSGGQVLSSFATGDGPTALGKYPDCYLQHGDPNGDGLINITDAVFLIQYIFNAGPAPVVASAGDANGDDLVNITDAVYVIQFIFNFGPPPAGCCD